MKTFAYLALIGTALAVRLTSDDTGAADDATQQAELELETMVATGGLDAVRGSDLDDDAAECLLKGVDGELERAGVDKEGRGQIAQALKEGRADDKTLGDAEDFLRGLAEAEGVASDDIDAALERAGKSALKCLKERKERKERKEGEPATEGDDDDQADAQAVALAQEEVDVEDVDADDLAAMSEGEKEDLAARVKEEGKGDEVMDRLRKAMKEATGEQKEALREMVEMLVGDDKPAGRK